MSAECDGQFVRRLGAEASADGGGGDNGRVGFWACRRVSQMSLSEFSDGEAST